MWTTFKEIRFRCLTHLRKKAWSLFQIEVLNQETTAQVGLVLESGSRWSVLSEIFPGSWGVDDTVKPGTLLEAERKEFA
jgi:hypothetical protein